MTKSHRYNYFAAFFWLAIPVLLVIGIGLGQAQVQAAPPNAVTATRQIYLPLINRQLDSRAATPTPTLTETPNSVPTATSTRTATPNTPPTAPPPSGNGWTMLAANPQRTSWTPEEVRGELQVEWYHPIEPYIPYKIQPIAANGKIYVATARGLFAFDASNGALLWVYGTEMPLGHSPTIATVNGKSVAYVGGMDHRVHAVDANSGQALTGYTPFEAGSGYDTNPLVIQDSFTSNKPIILIGNRDGFFYALDAVTGAKLWSYQTQGPISYSAAYKDGHVYFASNDNKAYALNVANGSLVWKKGGFPGSGFYSYWPVIYTHKATSKDYVIFNSGENYRQTEQAEPPSQLETRALNAYNLPGGTLPRTNPPVPGDWASGTATLDGSSLTNYFAYNSRKRVSFVLDAATGQEFTFADPSGGGTTFAPFGQSGITGSGSKFPPIINRMDGVYYQQTAYSDFNMWVSRGSAVGWKFGTQHLSLVSDRTFAGDEPTAYASGGRLIYWALCCDRAAGAFDVSIPYGQPNRGWFYFDQGGSLLPNKAPGYDQYMIPGSVYDWDMYGGVNGVYGKHGSNQSPPIPYQGKVYMLRGNTLLAFSNTATAIKLPLATAPAAQPAQISKTTAQLRQALETQVQKMLAVGPLRPGYMSVGILDVYGQGGWGSDERGFGEIFDYFQNPADTVYTLLLAYPHLSAGTQAQVKTYLQDHYGPGKTYDLTRIVHTGWGNGAAREVFSIPPEDFAIFGTPYKPPLNPSAQPICGGCGYWQNFPPFSFYAAWKYAQIVGNNDPNTAKALFNAMSSRIEAPMADNYLIHKPYFINLYAAGYLGYLNLKQLAGLGGDPTVQGYYDHMLALRVNAFAQDTPYVPDNTWIPDCLGVCANYQRTLSVARNFMFLTPEIADYMRQQIGNSVQSAVTDYQHAAPYWFVSKFDNTTGEGTIQPLYDYPALFQAKAWILKQPYNELVKWLDVPAFDRGDLFYIQNLVAALDAQ
ncbi:MAG: PQQ-binding-like beta-propeller repeat protein [Anaerolineae bacterium]|nr:PQQ-binding-like beta-propeller repeat protein [Anaerolineae bacterium]